MTTKKQRLEWLELLKVVHFDMECLVIDKDLDNNYYHYKLAIGNLRDIIERLQHDI